MRSRDGGRLSSRKAPKPAIDYPVLVVPLTTQQDALRFPGTVLIETTASNGLKQPSIALVFQLTVLDRKFLGKRLGEVSEAVVQALWSAFDEITDRS